MQNKALDTVEKMAHCGQRQTDWWFVSDRQDINTPSSLKALYLSKQKSKNQN